MSRTTERPRTGLALRVRVWLLTQARASKFWPLSLLDKNADIERLDEPIAAKIVVFFPMKLDAIYQIRQWYRPLQHLDRSQAVTVITRDSRTANTIRRESGLDCLTLATYGQLDHLLSLSDVKLFLYASHDALNFEALRFTSVFHIYIGHGDSDKAVSVSNQLKAYDYSFQPGQAAIDRLTANLMDFDVKARSKVIGQPQFDQEHQVQRASSQPPTVLYAPTWEGSQPSVSYGSVEDRGEDIIRGLSAKYRVIYRPHPLSGVVSSAYAAADSRCRELASRVDTEVPLEQSMADADILIADVSAVALNWLPTGKPLIITEPKVATGPSRLLETLPRLANSQDATGLVDTHLLLDPQRSDRQDLITYYVGNTSPGAATAAFVSHCNDLVDARDAMWATYLAGGATGP